MEWKHKWGHKGIEISDDEILIFWVFYLWEDSDDVFAKRSTREWIVQIIWKRSPTDLWRVFFTCGSSFPLFLPKKFIVLEKITVTNIEVARSSMQGVQELVLCSTAAHPPLQNKYCDAALNYEVHPSVDISSISLFSGYLNLLNF